MIPFILYSLKLKNNEQLDCSFFDVKKVSDSIGLGLFTKNFIKKETILGECTGLVGKGYDGYNYAWRYPSLYKKKKLYIDAYHFGNCFRFVNDLMDYNLEVVYLIKSDNTWGVFYYSTRNIYEGE